MEPTFGSLTFMFPMWNEEEMIHRTVDAARETATDLLAWGQIGDYEILLIDDASTDKTGAIADELAASDDHVRVVHHEVNRKLGGSVRTGLREARGDLVLYTDADMPFDLADLNKALRLMRVYEADILSAYRLDRTGEGVKRTVYSYVYNSMVRILLGMRIRDVNFAFKLLRRDILQHIELQSEGSFIDVELLAKAQRRGFHIIQFGVDYFPRDRGVSTLSSPAVISTIIKELVRLLPALRRVERLPERALRHR
ncbi:MAG TPA: glycosyltransferase family 2 protein [Acidimicrobiales bacterium]|nr:glycosyltransferase family 2 protein [Acidimicrobiales bacterium]